MGRVADLALLRLGEGEEEVVFTSACFGHRLRDGWPGWPHTKTDEFLEKFQTAFEPPFPPSFSENHVANFVSN